MGSAKFWKCDVLHRMPVDFAECVQCVEWELFVPPSGANRLRGDRPFHTGEVYWCWLCLRCDWYVFWTDERCHNPDCEGTKSADAEKVGDRAGLYVPEFPTRPEAKKPTQEELEDAKQKKKKGQAHRPVAGCPDDCPQVHEFRFSLRALGATHDSWEEPIELVAEVLPTIAKEEPVGELRWRIVSGPGAFVGNGKRTLTTNGADTRQSVSASGPGEVEVECTFHFGQASYPREQDPLRPNRVTLDFRGTPLDPSVGLTIASTGDLDPGDALCPETAIELQALTTLPAAEQPTLRWTLLDEDGRPFPAADEGTPRLVAKGGARQVERGLVEATPSQTVEVRPATRGRWTKAGATATWTPPAVLLRVELTTSKGIALAKQALRWHGVSFEHNLKVDTGTVGPLGTSKLEKRLYVGSELAIAGLMQVELGPGMERTTTLKGSIWIYARALVALGCTRDGFCVPADRWRGGVCQTHMDSLRQWAFRADHDDWLKLHVTYAGGPPPIRDAQASALESPPWYEVPGDFKALTAGSPEDEGGHYTAIHIDVEDSPGLRVPWTAEYEGTTYELQWVVMKDTFDTMPTLCRRQPDGTWGEFFVLEHYGWAVEFSTEVGEDHALSEEQGRYRRHAQQARPNFGARTPGTDEKKRYYHLTYDPVRSVGGADGGEEVAASEMEADT